MITGHLVQDRDEIGDLLKTIIGDAVQLMGAPDGYISVVNESDKLEVNYAMGLYSELPQCEIKKGEGANGEVLRLGKMLYVPDYQRFPCKLKAPEMDPGQYDARISVEQRRPDAGYLLYFLAQGAVRSNEEQLGLLRQYAFGGHCLGKGAG